MTLKAAFIFIAPEANPAQHQAQVKTQAVEVTTLAVASYAEAERAAKELVAAGIVAIELCGGFGIEGVARVKRAVSDQAAVGAVRFDCHPGLDFKSGDALFA
jgi:hypothetical protein